MEKEIKSKKKKNSGITLIALVITIIVLIILAGVSINLVLGNNGIIARAREAKNNYQKSAAEEEEGLAIENEIENYLPGIRYIDKDGKTQTLTKDTAVGTKIGTTTVDGQSLDWYLFDVSDDSKTAYLVSTPTCWVPDTSKEVNGAWVPKLVASPDTKTGAMNQAIQRKASATDGNYSYSYSSLSVTYKPSDNTLKYYKETNSLWSSQRTNIEFEKLNENEQCACYLADADIFSGIKNQVNNAKGNLQGKIQTLVGGPSIEQWTKAYGKQKITHQITAEYGSDLPGAPGYLYKVNNEEKNSGWYTNSNVIDGNDVYGAASTNKHTDATKYPFFSWCWIASPSSLGSSCVCGVIGRGSYLDGNGSCDNGRRLLLFASADL